MKQILIRSGEAVVEEVPAPKPAPGQILVRTTWSCVSPGTELAGAEKSKVSHLIERFRNDPARLRMTFDLLRERGAQAVYAKAHARLTFGNAVGYSCSGTVLDVGPGVQGFTHGDRVACAGSGYANHAELVAVPMNLVAKLPEEVGLAEASTVTLGAIALQGVRRAQVEVGARVGVIGLGMIGQLTVQILKAAGCKVFGMDLEPSRVAQARALGLDMAPIHHASPLDAAVEFSEGYGLDAVLLTASTPSDEPLHLAMQMARRKGRVVVVGDVGLAAKRDLMYAKELDLLISTSYGPGRYDPSYEEAGLDYPYAYVRWTENRNMHAYLELIDSRQVRLDPLIRERLPMTQAAAAYARLRQEAERPYTVLLQYATDAPLAHSRHLTWRHRDSVDDGIVRLGIIGAGSFAQGVHIPNLRKQTNLFSIEGIVTRRGHMATAIARQVQARLAATDYHEVLADPRIDAVLIATRPHDLPIIIEAALRAGKHVLAEKPLALTMDELTHLEQLVLELNASSAGCPTILIGFNRRYSPYAVRLREQVAQRTTPLHLMYRMNAAYMPPEHWVHGPEGGGRIRSEACHIFDLFHYLVGAPATRIHTAGIGVARHDIIPTDNVTVTIQYAEGSLCTLLYTAQGGADLPKEAMELHVGHQSFLLDDYRRLRGFGTKLDFRTKRQDKGHEQELVAFHQAIAGKLDTKALWEGAVETTRTTLEVDRQLREIGETAVKMPYGAEKER